MALQHLLAFAAILGLSSALFEGLELPFLEKLSRINCTHFAAPAPMGNATYVNATDCQRYFYRNRPDIDGKKFDWAKDPAVVQV